MSYLKNLGLHQGPPLVCTHSSHCKPAEGTIDGGTTYIHTYINFIFFLEFESSFTKLIFPKRYIKCTKFTFYLYKIHISVCISSLSRLVKILFKSAKLLVLTESGSKFHKSNTTKIT